MGLGTANQSALPQCNAALKLAYDIGSFMDQTKLKTNCFVCSVLLH